MGVAVLVVAIIALRHPKQSSSAAGTDTRTVTVAPSAPPLTRPASSSTSSAASLQPSDTESPSKTSLVGALPLVVLNDTMTANLARDAAHRFEGAGWNVTSYDENYSNNILSTAAYYDPSVENAKDAARTLRKEFPAIKRVVPKFSGLVAGPIVVILTTDYSPN